MPKNNKLYREYKPAKANVIFSGVVLSAMMGFGVWLLWSGLFKAGQTHATSVVISICGLAFILGSIGYAIDMLVGKFIISENEIVSVGLWGKTILAIKEIDAYELTDQALVLYSSVRHKHVSLSKYCEGYGRVVAWASHQFKAKNKLDAQRERAEMLANPRFGASREEVTRKAGQVRRLVKPLNILAWAVAFAMVFFYGHAPLALTAVCALLPLVGCGIYNWTHGLAKLYVERDEAHPSLMMLVCVCIGALIWRAVDENVIGHPRPFWLLFLGIAAVSGYGCTRYERRSPSETTQDVAIPIVTTVFFCMLYSYTVVVLFNDLLDQSSPTYYSTSVVKKWVGSGKNRSPRVKLAPWPGMTEDEVVRVSVSEYRAVNEGDTVRVAQYRGAFDIPYYELVVE